MSEDINMVSDFSAWVLLGFVFVLFFLILTIKKAKDYIINRVEYRIDEKFDIKMLKLGEILKKYEDFLYALRTYSNGMIGKYSDALGRYKQILTKFEDIDDEIRCSVKFALDEGLEEYKKNLCDIVKEYRVISKSISSTIDDFAHEFSKVKKEAEQITGLLAQNQKLKDRLERRDKDDDRNFQEFKN